MKSANILILQNARRTLTALRSLYGIYVIMVTVQKAIFFVIKRATVRVLVGAIIQILLQNYDLSI